MNDSELPSILPALNDPTPLTAYRFDGGRSPGAVAMRIFYVAIACAAVIAGAGAIRADVIGTGLVAISPLPPGSAIPREIPRDMGLGPNGSREPKMGGPAAGFGNPLGLPKPRENTIRLAQTDEEEEVRSTGNPSVAPLKWVGVLKNPTPTQKQPGLYSYCTGQFITPNVVLTAGHCLNDLSTGTSYDLSKQTFILQYQNGVGSHTFKTVCGATSPQWAFPSNYTSMNEAQKDAARRTASQHDFAMILVDGNSPTGVMPYQLDWKGKVTKAVRIGYAIDKLNGEIVQQARGHLFFADEISMFAPQSVTNLVTHWAAITDLTQGTSGGAWIVHFSTTEDRNNNILVAVSSFNDSKYPGAIFGAYLTAAEFNPLLTFVSNGCK